jgi:hypothetical protein
MFFVATDLAVLVLVVVWVEVAVEVEVAPAGRFESAASVV